MNLPPRPKPVSQRISAELSGAKGAAALLGLLIFAKSVFFSFYITPLWSGPDEVGHVSYVLDLARGDITPILEGRRSARLDGGVVEHSRASVRGNWISQHPPLYYALAAVPTRMTLALTSDSELVFRAPRVASAFFAGLLMFSLVCLLINIGVHPAVGISVAVGVSTLPMFSHLASSASNDLPVALFVVLSLNAWLRFERGGSPRDARRFALWVLLGSLTKATFWPVGGLMVVLAAIRMSIVPGTLRRRWRTILSFLAVAGIGPGTWIVREMATRSSPTAGQLERLSSFAASEAGTASGLAAFLSQAAILDTYWRTFIGLIGWHGGTGPANNNRYPTWMLTDDPALAFYSAILLTLGLLLTRQSLTNALESSASLDGRRFAWRMPVRLATAATLATLSLAWIVAEVPIYAVSQASDWIRPLSMGIILFGGLLLVLFPSSAGDEQLLRVWGAVSLGALAYFVIERFSGWGGTPAIRAVHGRYLWGTVMPLLVVSIAATRNLPSARFVAPALALTALWIEFHTLVRQTLPFFGIG